MSTKAQLYSNTATIRFLGTMSNAEIRIRTPYPAAPCGSVTKIALKDLEKYDPRDAGALRAGFSLILGLDPYLADEKLVEHCPTVLHLSLRDICVNVILASQNIVDDVDHCLKAKTSLHLTEIAMGNRDFVSGSLVDVLEKKFKLVS